MIDAVELLRELIRFDTTNPPGNEEACVAHIESLLRKHGIESQRYETAAGRPNPGSRWVLESGDALGRGGHDMGDRDLHDAAQTGGHVLVEPCRRARRQRRFGSRG